MARDTLRLVVTSQARHGQYHNAVSSAPTQIKTRTMSQTVASPPIIDAPRLTMPVSTKALAPRFRDGNFDFLFGGGVAGGAPRDTTTASTGLRVAAMCPAFPAGANAALVSYLGRVHRVDPWADGIRGSVAFRCFVTTTLVMDFLAPWMTAREVSSVVLRGFLSLMGLLRPAVLKWKDMGAVEAALRALIVGDCASSATRAAWVTIFDDWWAEFFVGRICANTRLFTFMYTTLGLPLPKESAVQRVERRASLDFLMAAQMVERAGRAALQTESKLPATGRVGPVYMQLSTIGSARPPEVLHFFAGFAQETRKRRTGGAAPVPERLLTATYKDLVAVLEKRAGVPIDGDRLTFRDDSGTRIGWVVDMPDAEIRAKRLHLTIGDASRMEAVNRVHRHFLMVTDALDRPLASGATIVSQVRAYRQATRGIHHHYWGQLDDKILTRLAAVVEKKHLGATAVVSLLPDEPSVAAIAGLAIQQK